MVRAIRRLRQSKPGVLATAVMVAALVFPLGVLASHQFGDVPDGNIFHGNIDAIADAGITSGCGGGNYCPSSPVNRDQMAAFMHRGFGRTAADSVFGSSFTTNATTVLSTDITPGGVGGTNFVKADGTVSLYVTSPSACPCFYEAYVTLDGVQAGQENYVTVAASGEQVVNVPVSAVIDVGVPDTVTVGVVVDQYIGSSSTQAYGSLTVVTAPFGSGGGSTLSIQESPAEGSGRPGE